jgi:hypothetical protein
MNSQTDSYSKKEKVELVVAVDLPFWWAVPTIFTIGVSKSQ